MEVDGARGRHVVLCYPAATYILQRAKQRKLSTAGNYFDLR